jgi:hypothetical protein
MTQDLKFANDTLVTGQSIQSDVEVAGTSLLFSDSDVNTIRLYITWANNTSWQGCECYVIDPDGNYHYVFSAGSLPFGSGTRADAFDITAASGNFPFTQDGTWEFYLEDQMYNQCDIIQVAVFVKCTDSKMPATHNEVSWYGAGYYRGGIDLSNNANHIYTHNGASIVADTNSGGSNALSFSSSLNQRWSDGPVADYNNQSQWSVSAWVKPGQTTAAKQMIFCNHGYVRGNFQLYQTGDEFGLFIGYFDPVASSGDSEKIETTNLNISSGSWYNITATFDGAGSSSTQTNDFDTDWGDWSTVGYGGGTGADTTRSTIESQSSPYSVRMVNSTETADRTGIAQTLTIGSGGGTVSGYYFCSRPTHNNDLNLELWIDGSYVSEFTPSATQSWVQFSFNLSAGSQTVALVRYQDEDAASGVVYIDTISITNVVNKLNLFVDDVAVAVSRTTAGNGLTAMPYNSFAGAAPDQTIGAMKSATSSTVYYPFDGEVDACRTVNSVYTSNDITWLASGRDVAGGPVDFKAFYIPSPSVLGVFQ